MSPCSKQNRTVQGSPQEACPGQQVSLCSCQAARRENDRLQAHELQSPWSSKALSSLGGTLGSSGGAHTASWTPPYPLGSASSQAPPVLRPGPLGPWMTGTSAWQMLNKRLFIPTPLTFSVPVPLQGELACTCGEVNCWPPLQGRAAGVEGSAVSVGPAKWPWTCSFPCLAQPRRLGEGLQLLVGHVPIFN